MRTTSFFAALGAALAVASFANAQTVSPAFTYQGTFADAGAPANGFYDFEFEMYQAASGGSALASTTQGSVSISGGLVNTTVEFARSNYDGQAKWLEVHVRRSGEATYTVLSPRQALTPVPYANGLPMPFQRDVSTGDQTAFALVQHDTGAAIGASVPAGSAHPAIGGTGVDSPGVAGDSTNNAGVRGASVAADGVRGLSTDGFGVHGVGAHGVWAEGGLLATANIPCDGAGCASVVSIRNDSVGSLILALAGANPVFRVSGGGGVFANGGFNTGGADLAEYVPANERLQAGDVVEIDAEHGDALRRASRANSTTVAGVVSTRPGVSLNDPDGASTSRTDMPLLALSGRVPVKASIENGAIRAGDLLVSSSRPGLAMRAPSSPAAGTVIGKAMRSLDRDGEVEMLVMLR